MKVLIQNLQKQSGLATDLIQQYEPDVMLAQEINISSENDASGVCRINKSSDIEQSNYKQLGRATLGFQ